MNVRVRVEIPLRKRVCRLFEALNAQHDVHWLTGILGTWRVQYNCSSRTSPAVKKHTKMLTPTNAPEPPRTMLACCLLLSTAWNYPTAAGRLQLRARPQLMRAADEGDAPATTPATQVVRRDLGAYVGLTSIVAVVPAVDWAGLGPETSNVARLLYFSAVALGSRCTSASNGKTSVSRRPSRLAPPPLSPGADWHFKWQAKKKKEGTLAVHDKQGRALSKKIRRGDGSLV